MAIDRFLLQKKSAHSTIQREEAHKKASPNPPTGNRIVVVQSLLRSF
jgi:hypothetical protein|tara:strand:- start:136 stop:276 length:141 start_codon:yes stop_codon:yes gene_type:complete